MAEKMGAVSGADVVEHPLHIVPQFLDAAVFGAAQQLLELGERQLNRIQIRTVRRQVEHARPSSLNHLCNASALMAGEVVHHHNVTWLESPNQYLLHESLKHIPVDGSIDSGCATHAGVIQRGDERRGFPVSMWNFGDQAFSPRGAASQPRHVGLGPGLINEDQLGRIKSQLAHPPCGTGLRHVRTILLGGVDRLFLYDRFSSRSALLMAQAVTLIPSLFRSSTSVASGCSATSSPRR